MMLHATGTVGIDWLLTFLAYSTAILGGVSIARIVLRREFPEIVWRLAIVAAIAAALPGSARFGSVIDLGTPLAALSRALEAQTARFAAPAPNVPERIQPAPRPATAPAKSSPVSTTRTDSGISGRVAVSTSDLRDTKSHAGRQWLFRPSYFSVVSLWLVIAGALLAKLAFDYARAARAFGERRPLEPDHVAHALARELCESAGIRVRPRLTASTSLNSPVSLIGNEICIPTGRLRVDQQLRGLLAHELAHQTAIRALRPPSGRRARLLLSAAAARRARPAAHPRRARGGRLAPRAPATVRRLRRRSTPALRAVSTANRRSASRWSPSDRCSGTRPATAASNCAELRSLGRVATMALVFPRSRSHWRCRRSEPRRRRVPRRRSLPCQRPGRAGAAAPAAGSPMRPKCGYAGARGDDGAGAAAALAAAPAAPAAPAPPSLPAAPSIPRRRTSPRT